MVRSMDGRDSGSFVVHAFYPVGGPEADHCTLRAAADSEGTIWHCTESGARIQTNTRPRCMCGRLLAAPSASLASLQRCAKQSSRHFIGRYPYSGQTTVGTSNYDLLDGLQLTAARSNANSLQAS